MVEVGIRCDVFCLPACVAGSADVVEIVLKKEQICGPMTEPVSSPIECSSGGLDRADVPGTDRGVEVLGEAAQRSFEAEVDHRSVVCEQHPWDRLLGQDVQNGCGRFEASAPGGDELLGLQVVPEQLEDPVQELVGGVAPKFGPVIEPRLEEFRGDSS